MKTITKKEVEEYKKITKKVEKILNQRLKIRQKIENKKIPVAFNSKIRKEIELELEEYVKLREKAGDYLRATSKAKLQENQKELRVKLAKIRIRKDIQKEIKILSISKLNTFKYKPITLTISLNTRARSKEDYFLKIKTDEYMEETKSRNLPFTDYKVYYKEIGKIEREILKELKERKKELKEAVREADKEFGEFLLLHKI